MLVKAAIAIIVAIVGLVSAAPTATTGNHPSRSHHLTGVTHTVVAGKGGLRFDPDNIVAETGDVVEWHFLAANHSVAQSSFLEPCEPLLDRFGEQVGFFGGFNFATQVGIQAPDVFQIVIKDTRPIWFYCPQLQGKHCKNGMTGVVNQNFDNQDFSLRVHREKATQVDNIIIPNYELGGQILSNPNPNGGF